MRRWWQRAYNERRSGRRTQQRPRTELSRLAAPLSSSVLSPFGRPTLCKKSTVCVCVFVRARVQRSLCSLTLQLFQSLRHQVEEKEEKGVVGGGDTKKKKKKIRKKETGSPLESVLENSGKRRETRKGSLAKFLLCCVWARQFVSDLFVLLFFFFFLPPNLSRSALVFVSQYFFFFLLFFYSHRQRQ